MWEVRIFQERVHYELLKFNVVLESNKTRILGRRTMCRNSDHQLGTLVYLWSYKFTICKYSDFDPIIKFQRNRKCVAAGCAPVERCKKAARTEFEPCAKPEEFKHQLGDLWQFVYNETFQSQHKDWLFVTYHFQK